MKRPAGRLRAVFDCNTYIQTIAFHGPAAKCLEFVESGDVELFISKPVLAELRRMLAYEEVLAISPNMTPERIGAFLQRLEYRAIFLKRVPHLMNYPRDADDEPYIDLALAAKADYLVSRDKDILALMTGHSPACKRFRRAGHWLRVVDPVDFLEVVRHQG